MVDVLFFERAGLDGFDLRSVYAVTTFDLPRRDGGSVESVWVCGVDALAVYTPTELYEKRIEEGEPKTALDHFRVAEFCRTRGARVTLVFDGAPFRPELGGQELGRVSVRFPPPGADADSVIRELIDQARGRRAATPRAGT